METDSAYTIDLRDEKQFETLFKSYFQALTAFAYQYLNDSIQSEETVQEVFTQLWQKADQIEIRSNIKSYLYGAVRNSCLNQLKHNKVIQAHEESVRFHGEEGTAHDFLELEELQSKIKYALDELPEKCRQIFEMSRFEEKKYKEIAEELNLSIKTVETQMGRALKVMRNVLGTYLSQGLIWLAYWIEKFL